MVDIINELTGGCNDDSTYNFLNSLKYINKAFIWVDIIRRIREEVDCKITYGFDYQCYDDTDRLKFEKINIVLTKEYNLEIISGEMNNFTFVKTSDNEYILKLINKGY